MLESLIITLREGVEAALIVGITLAYLKKIGRADLRRVVYAALLAAFVASLGGAFLLAHANLNEDIFEGWIMLAAAAFVISMVWFMARAARRMRRDIEIRVAGIAEHGSAVGLFVFVFLMVLREGVETVLVLSAVSLNSTELLSLFGTVLGIGLAVAFGFVFVKGSLRINLQKFFHVTTVILVFVAVQLVVSGLHELSENGVLPSSRSEMALVGPIVRNDIFFFVTILALAAMMVLFEYRRRGPEIVPGSSQAEQRKAHWTARRERLWMASVYASSFVFILMATAQFIYARTTSMVPAATPVSFTAGRFTLRASELADGDLHRFIASIGGVPVRFWLVRRSDGSIAAAFDSCEVCGPAGFYLSKNGLIICKNCSAPINPASVGRSGGCNPIPLKAAAIGDAVTLSEADVALGRAYFQH